MFMRQLFDRETWTYSYLLADLESGEAALIDSVIGQIDRDMGLIKELGFKLKYVLETHVHADHITGAGQLRQRTGALIGVSRHAPVACADLKLSDREILKLGNLDIQVLETPGHTPCSLSFFSGSMVFTGDALFVRGTGRTDFQDGDAGVLYDAIQHKLFALPDTTQVYPGHDYKGHSASTIGEEKRFNPRLAQRTREAFIDIMNQLQLADPKYIHVAVPANQHCGLSPGD